MKMFKKNDGFTLIELVVVIAILAILAGVATAGYSGYIKRANKTADDQVLEVVNTAIAAALSMEGEDPADASTYFKVTNGKTLEAQTLTDGAKNVVWNTFKEFYSESTTFTLKYYATVEFDSNGALVGVTATTNP